MQSVIRLRSRGSSSGGTQSMDAVRVYLEENKLWLTVWAPKGTNVRFPNNISIGSVKEELSLQASTYEDKKIFIYDLAPAFSENWAPETGVESGGHEYMDDYVVAPGCKLYATVTAQTTAGVLDPVDPYENQQKEWDGFTYVQIHDESRWEKVLLPDIADDLLTANMLKQTVLAKINVTPTVNMLKALRVYSNDSGVPSGLPFKGTDTVWRHLWYTVVIDAEISILVLTSGNDCPSPDADIETKDWETVAA